MRFLLLDMDIILNEVILPSALPGWGSTPWGALTQLTDQPEIGETLRFSDLGYVREDGVPYLPFITEGLDLTRSLTLSADALGGSFSVGVLTLANPEGALDTLLQTRVNDHLPVRLFEGRQLWDGARGIWTDPPQSHLAPVFAGLGKNWQPGQGTFSVTLLDATYWLDASMTVQVYGGAGRLDGDSNVAGRNQPRLRGTVCNITPVLIDSSNYVYQVSDGPADITALYEGGFGDGITFGGLVDDIYETSPGPGTYVVQSSAAGTWLRLGTRPVYGITVDAFGRFRSGAAPAMLLDLLRRVLIEDLVLPQVHIDREWAETSTVGSWAGGWYWDGSESVTGRQAVSTLLSGLGISLIPTRTGTLLPVQLSVPSDPDQATLVLDPDVISAISPIALDSSVDPPTWRWRIGWQHNFTVQTSGSGLHPQASADRQALIAEQDRAAVWFDTKVKSSWRLPSDPDLVTTALYRQEDAQEIAATHGALWGQRRHLWAVDVPPEIASQAELGMIVSLQAPVPGAGTPITGVVVSEHRASSASTVTLTILV